MRTVMSKLLSGIIKHFLEQQGETRDHLFSLQASTAAEENIAK
jgi:hypothetical protein